jgi:hypothetical protein
MNVLEMSIELARGLEGTAATIMRASNLDHQAASGETD